MDAAAVTTVRRRSARVLGALLALVGAATAAFAASGCGGQAAAPAAAASPHHESAAARGAPGRPPTRAQALAFARAVNLTASDVPEARVRAWHGRSQVTATERRRREQEYDACEVPAVHTYLSVHSPDLARGRELEAEGFVSSVSFVRDPHALSSALARLGRPSVLDCLAHVATKELDAHKIRFARWGHLHIVPLPVPLQGLPTFGFRMTVTLDIPFEEVTVPLYADYLGFAEGHALVGALTISATQPVPAGTEGELVALLHTRAADHRL